MSGKVAVITGSSRGIGRAIAERLAQHGSKVVISSRNATSCDQVADTINARHGAGTALSTPANISLKSDLQHLIEEATRRLGKIDVLVCNAASNPYHGPMSGLPDAAFRKVLENNIVANHWLVTMVTPQMIERRDGAIIVVSSIGGFKGSDVLGAYSISKAADVQLVRNLAVELGKYNIRSNCIAPGLIKTDFARALWEDQENLKRTEERNPMGRIGEPDEIAGAAVFLASRAGSYVNGQTIIVDGGTLAV
ncbi:SDR family NAD(P)-dependent oxidoreductase [Bradyrhizobium sp. HKCCYLS20291]|uniref:SDR family NAD(P)-dependent oxidoreductase n=1 Tax=Bradyrhizobium sp. HKCCYLS20291 TaxID=3420766 RepID=UPI003EC03683